MFKITLRPDFASFNFNMFHFTNCLETCGPNRQYPFQNPEESGATHSTFPFTHRCDQQTPWHCPADTLGLRKHRQVRFRLTIGMRRLTQRIQRKCRRVVKFRQHALTVHDVTEMGRGGTRRKVWRVWRNGNFWMCWGWLGKRHRHTNGWVVVVDVKGIGRIYRPSRRRVDGDDDGAVAVQRGNCSNASCRNDWSVRRGTGESDVRRDGRGVIRVVDFVISFCEIDDIRFGWIRCFYKKRRSEMFVLDAVSRTTMWKQK